MSAVENFLKSKDIEFVRHEHPAVFTCEEAEKYCVDIPGIAGKNLFLKGKKGDRYFLVILPAKKRADLKKIAEIAKESKVSFAQPEILRSKLGLEPGSVSPFGLLNDAKHEIIVYIDKEIYDAAVVNFHPNINTASLVLSQEMFRKFLQLLENKIEVVEL